MTNPVRWLFSSKFGSASLLCLYLWCLEHKFACWLDRFYNMMGFGVQINQNIFLFLVLLLVFVLGVLVRAFVPKSQISRIEKVLALSSLILIFLNFGIVESECAGRGEEWGQHRKSPPGPGNEGDEVRASHTPENRLTFRRAQEMVSSPQFSASDIPILNRFLSGSPEAGGPAAPSVPHPDPVQHPPAVDPTPLLGGEGRVNTYLFTLVRKEYERGRGPGSAFITPLSADVLGSITEVIKTELELDPTEMDSWIPSREDTKHISGLIKATLRELGK